MKDQSEKRQISTTSRGEPRTYRDILRPLLAREFEQRGGNLDEVACLVSDERPKFEDKARTILPPR